MVVKVGEGLEELEIPVELYFCVTGCGLVLLVLTDWVADVVTG